MVLFKKAKLYQLKNFKCHSIPIYLSMLFEMQFRLGESDEIIF